METNYIIIPFDIERAKRIANKEEDGKIVTRDGRNVRVICWDARCDDNIVALIENENGIENPMSYTSDGTLFLTSESPADLMLSAPEWSTFKAGDIITMRRADTRGFCTWISIIKSISMTGMIEAECYVSLCLDGDKDSVFPFTINLHRMSANWARKANVTEVYELIEALKEHKDPLTKECLKRFFPNYSDSEKSIKEYKFEPFDRVLVRDSKQLEWQIDIFREFIDDGDEAGYKYSCFYNSWNYCIPYNDETKHLLKTTNDWNNGY